MDELTPPQAPQRQSRGLALPLLLFVATCMSTHYVGGWQYSLALMTTLLAHELGHFIQAIRYRVPASLPFFIPIPAPPIGTMGAVILMQPGKGNRRELFDIAITGPLAGLVFAVLFSIIGLYRSDVIVPTEEMAGGRLGEPLLFKWLAYLTIGPLGENQDILLDPVAFAGWVGIFITALNLFPIGQLDGGHILYALLRRRAHTVARTVLIAAAIAVVIWQLWAWTLMLLLLLMMGPVHPPTADDNVPLGPTRTILGWLSLLFVIVGFTPTPFYF